MEDAKFFSWQQLPFYTVQQILKNLHYPNILKTIMAIPRLHKIYKDIDSCAESKFIFDQNVDNSRKLVSCRNLRQIYLDFRNININESSQLIILLNIHKK